MLTVSDYVSLVGLLSFCGFISYTVHEISCAIGSYLND